MSPFEFVTVFCSLIVGLALSHILRAVSDLYEIRERVKTDEAAQTGLGYYLYKRFVA
jgi:hypothetical protein